jgi:hypothetical protein
MLGEIREETKLTRENPGHHTGFILEDLRVICVEMGVDHKRQPRVSDFSARKICQI